MMTEEKKIKQMTGGDNGFRVPEGYFEHFSQKMMEKLPNETPVLPESNKMTPEKRPVFTPIWKRAVRWTLAAAMLTGVVFGVCLKLGQKADLQHTAQQEEVESVGTQGEYMDEALDYALINNHEIYMYLSENH